MASNTVRVVIPKYGTNYLAFTYVNQYPSSFKSFLKFLPKTYFVSALTANPILYMDVLNEFWNSTVVRTVVQEPRVVSMVVNCSIQGQQVEFNENDVNKALGIPTNSMVEHAVAFVNGDQYYGTKANINIWSPQVSDQNEFSLSQVWVIYGSFSNDLNTIEAGWKVSPELYGDSCPRFFTYWTNDAYQSTGCYNLLCSGFVQTNNKIAIGAAISPVSSDDKRQFDIGIMIWKLFDPKHGNWWFQFGTGLIIGHCPSFLFTQLRSHANMVQFGGEIVNSCIELF
ncbi:protein neprosin-like [Apium graveolens]|uniref:protein neprosin-like n=1 Tax=Apium graveolens TaxID=4045 RepID=UPI003D7C0C5D